jgi:hypothetical protein
MRNIFTQIGIKTLLQLNIGSIVLIAFCDVFALSVFISKGFQEGIEKWKFLSMIAVVAIITLLFAGSIVSFFIFLKMKNSEKP